MWRRPHKGGWPGVRYSDPSGGQQAPQEPLGLGALGLARTCSGGPRSMIGPSWRKATSSATSRAKPISWVAITIVIPSAFRSRTAASTSPTSSGSRALVTSSSSSARGRRRGPGRWRPAAAGRRRGWSGRSPSRPASPKRASSSRALLLGLARGTPCARAGAEDDVLEHRQVREEVVGLEDDAEAPADRHRLNRRVGDHLAVEEDVAVVDLLEQVDAAQQRRLARAGGADQGDASCSPTARSMPRSTSRSPKDLVTPRTSMDGRSPRHRALGGPLGPLRSTIRASGHGDRQVEQRRRDQRRVVEGPTRRRSGPPGKPRAAPEDRDQGHVLLQRDEVVEQRRARPGAPPAAGSRGASPGPR